MTRHPRWADAALALLTIATIASWWAYFATH